MTSIRKSICFCRERDGYGTGIHDSSEGAFTVVQFAEYIPSTYYPEMRIAKYSTFDHWIAPPPGSMFTHTHSRTAQRIQTTGSKFWDAQAYGQLQGTWEWTFPFSYDYIEPLLFVFEDVEISLRDIDDEMLESYIYRLQKANNMRVPSFTMRTIIDHKMIGSTGCEEVILKGCVVQSMQMSKSNSASPINISLRGFYASEELTYSASVPRTVYMEPTLKYYNLPGNIDETPDSWKRTAEWAGLYRGLLGSARYMANVESLDIQLSNSSDRVFSVCSPFAANYYEGLTQISLTANMWYSDPMQYRTLLMAQNGNIFAPRAKGDCIVDEFDIITTDLQDEPVPGIYDKDPFSSEHKVPPKYVKGASKFVQESATGESSALYLYIRLMEAALKSYTSDKGEGSPLKDNMSGVDCRKMTMDLSSIRAVTMYSRIGAILWCQHYRGPATYSGS